MPRFPVALAVLTFAALPAMAADGDGNCYDPLKISEGFTPTIARVSAAEPRIPFRRNKSSDKACPSEAANCRSKAYLVPNDEVFVGPPEGAYVCAAIVSAKGRMTAGWLPKVAVTMQPATPVSLDDWLGTWVAPEQKIIIKRGKKPGTLTFDATATFGALDPERVKRGAVNMGEFKAEWAPKGGFIAFAVGDKGTLPIEKAEESDCKVHLVRAGVYLISEDNRQCGGMNVSFSSVMRRGK